MHCICHQTAAAAGRRLQLSCAHLLPTTQCLGLVLCCCRSLRVLNALRSSEVGLPLTHTQVEALTMPVLVSRLVNARRHLLALRIAEMLGLGADVVGPGLCFWGAC